MSNGNGAFVYFYHYSISPKGMAKTKSLDGKCKFEFWNLRNNLLQIFKFLLRIL